MYFASVDGFVYKINPDSGAVIWNTSTPIGLEIAMEGAYYVGNGLAVIGSGGAKNASWSRTMYALNATNGKFVWVTHLESQQAAIWTDMDTTSRLNVSGP